MTASSLPAPSRHIVLTLLLWSDNATATILRQHRKSLSEIAQATGLSRRAVTEHLDLLDQAGWVERNRPSLEEARAGTKTGYRLLIPREPSALPPPALGHDVPQGPPAETGNLGHQVPQETPNLGQEVPYPRAPGSQKRSTSVEVHVVGGSVKTPAVAEAAPTKGAVAEARQDVERLCRHLADRIVGNGSRRPTITKGWRDTARLMLDKDGLSESQIAWAIDWCQANEFWRSNIMSMTKLRKHYDRLRLQADGERTASNGHRPSTTDAAVDQALSLADHYHQKGE